MSKRTSLATVLAASTILVGAAYAADQATTSTSKESPAVAAADKDVGKLSADGASAFRDLHLARLAIFNADPAQAKTSIAKAKSELDKAKTDEAVFTKAESELKAPVGPGKSAASTQPSASPEASKPIQWLPIDGQLTLGDDFVATPQKAAAVSEANKALANKDQKGALEKLKLADVNVNFTLAVVPLAKTTADIDQAATLIDEGKYYEANAMLKQAEDGVRFDMIDVVEMPKAQQAQQAKTETKDASATKPAK